MEGTIGEIRMFAGTFAPRGWAFCQGQILSIAANTALFSILGTTYGGNGTSNFALPNLSSRVPVGTGSFPGFEQVVLGEMAGNPTVTLTQANMPAHNHTASATVTGTVTPPCLSDQGNGTSPANQYQAASTSASFTARGQTPDSNMGSSPISASANVTIGIAGSSLPFDNRNPFLGMNYIICTQGIYPSRN